MNKEKQNKILNRILIGISIIVVVLVVFRVGMFVGYKKASFSYSFGENYYRTFGGQKLNTRMGMMGGFFRDNMPSGHGVTGKVIKIDLPTLVVEGKDNLEKIIDVDNKTLVRNMRDEATINDLKIDDDIIVIGEPNEKGEVVAKLIRIVRPKTQTDTITK